MWADQVLRVLRAWNSAITWLHRELWIGKDIVSLMKKRVMDCRSWETEWSLCLKTTLPILTYPYFTFWMQIFPQCCINSERWTCWIGCFNHFDLSRAKASSFCRAIYFDLVPNKLFKALCRTLKTTGRWWLNKQKVGSSERGVYSLAWSSFRFAKVSCLPEWQPRHGQGV